jgi:hypothetical protein
VSDHFDAIRPALEFIDREHVLDGVCCLSEGRLAEALTRFAREQMEAEAERRAKETRELEDERAEALCLMAEWDLRERKRGGGCRAGYGNCPTTENDGRCYCPTVDQGGGK